MKVFLSELAETKLIELLGYIQDEWGVLVKEKFLKTFISKKDQISQQPMSCPESSEFKGLFKCVVSKQTTFFYRIENSEIEIITIFDTRQNPKKICTKI